jgi:hypothetical protein
VAKPGRNYLDVNFSLIFHTTTFEKKGVGGESIAIHTTLVKKISTTFPRGPRRRLTADG